jgi:SanA protein
MQNKVLKIGIATLFLFVFFIALGVLMVFVYHQEDNVPNRSYDYGVVFGAAIRPHGRLSETLKSRMLTAIQLYREGTVKKLILSGAKKNQMKPGEPRSMYRFAVKHGIPPENLILDEMGDSTMETILNVKKKFRNRAPQILFISSFFHLARIQITARILGIPYFDAYPSENEHPKIVYFVFREAVAIWYYLFKSLGLRLVGF